MRPDNLDANGYDIAAAKAWVCPEIYQVEPHIRILPTSRELSDPIPLKTLPGAVVVVGPESWDRNVGMRLSGTGISSRENESIFLSVLVGATHENQLSMSANNGVLIACRSENHGNSSHNEGTPLRPLAIWNPVARDSHTLGSHFVPRDFTCHTVPVLLSLS